MVALSLIALFAFTTLRLAAGHGLITSIKGANGITGVGFGIDPSISRNGTRRDPFKEYVSIIRDREIASGKTGVCGRTRMRGNNNVVQQLASEQRVLQT